jgi:hypothetical protein
MTYVPKTHALTRRAQTRPAMGGVADVMKTLFPEKDVGVACVNQAQPTVAGLDAKIKDLAANWNPTGFYSPDQVRTIVQQVLNTTSSARAALESQMSGNLASSARSNVMQSIADLGKAGQRSLDYLNVARLGKTVDAPGLKQWVLNSMNAASSGMVTAYVVDCEKPAIFNVMMSFVAVMTVAYNIIKKIAGIVLAAGEAAVEIAKDIAESAFSIYKIVKYGAIAAAAVFVAIKLREVQRRGSR